MDFVSTRGGERTTGAWAVVKGLAADGGLFVPETFPAVSRAELTEMLGMDYPERAARILGKFFGEYGEEDLLGELRRAFARFEGEDPVPLVRIEGDLYILELFRGPTCSHKDMAFSVFPHLLGKGCALTGVKEDLLVVTATSGDAGKAAMEGFRGLGNVKTVVFYPDEGVSKMQKLQLCTEECENAGVIAVKGGFDDCYAGVKKLFRSEKCRTALAERGYRLTSANALNVGCLLPQVAVYFSAYLDLVSSEQIAMGDKVDFALPAVSFGNAIAGDYARRMGLPIGKLLVAGNKNCVLGDFFRTGTYDTKRPLYRTMSPALDYLFASDIERLLFELSSRNAPLTAERMEQLRGGGKCTLRAEELKELTARFYFGSTGEDDTVDSMYEFFTEFGYPLDTQTGVALHAAQEYVYARNKDAKAEKPPMVLVATASPYKFPQDVLYALTGNDVKDSFKGVKRINLLTAMKVPEAIKAVRYKPLRFKTVVPPEKMYQEMLKLLG